MEWYKYTNYSKWTGIPEKNKKGENEAARKLPDIQISPTSLLGRKKIKKRYNPKETKNRKMEPVSALIKFA